MLAHHTPTLHCAALQAALLNGPAEHLLCVQWMMLVLPIDHWPGFAACIEDTVRSQGSMLQHDVILQVATPLLDLLLCTSKFCGTLFGFCSPAPGLPIACWCMA